MQNPKYLMINNQSLGRLHSYDGNYHKFVDRMIDTKRQNISSRLFAIKRLDDD